MFLDIPVLGSSCIANASNWEKKKKCKTDTHPTPNPEDEE